MYDSRTAGTRYRRHAAICILSSLATMLAATAALGVLGRVQPWFSPRTWVPVSGMLYGNALTATSLAIQTLTRELATNGDRVELRLARGASWREAVEPVLQDTYSAALTPTVNSLAVTGVVHIPGMMTGQILAGQAAGQAAAYQVLILFLIATANIGSVLLLTTQTISSLIDRRFHRLRLTRQEDENEKSSAVANGTSSEGINKNISNLPGSPWYLRLVRSFRGGPTSKRGKPIPPGQGDTVKTPEIQTDGSPINAGATTAECHSTIALWRTKHFSDGSAAEATPPVVLSVRDLHIERTGARVSFDLHAGERLGLSGPSGVGKSQILRTLAGLEATTETSSCPDAMRLLRSNKRDGDVGGPSMGDMPQWRRRVALVPQQRTSFDGTPRDFFQEVQDYDSQKHNQQNNGKQDSDDLLPALVVNGDSNRRKCSTRVSDAVAIAAEWGLPAAAWDQPWSTLSGGESQRAALAVALAFQPDVLLLDESTSGLDETSQRAVERTLAALNIPIVMVSHSPQQLERFCNSRIDIMKVSPASRGDVDCHCEDYDGAANKEVVHNVLAQ